MNGATSSNRLIAATVRPPTALPHFNNCNSLMNHFDSKSYYSLWNRILKVILWIFLHLFLVFHLFVPCWICFCRRISITTLPTLIKRWNCSLLIPNQQNITSIGLVTRKQDLLVINNHFWIQNCKPVINIVFKLVSQTNSVVGWWSRALSPMRKVLSSKLVTDDDLFQTILDNFLDRMSF